MAWHGGFLEEKGDDQLVYTQPPHLTEEEMESFLKEAKFARFCSLNPDGTIHAATVNYRYENGRFFVVTPTASRKARNVRRNGIVTLLVDVIGKGLSETKGALIYGKGEVKEGTFSEMVFVNETWMRAEKVEAWTKRLYGLTDWVTISVEPEGTASWDYAKDEEFAAVFQE